MIVGIVCGTLAALAWAMGFVAAKHGVQIGFSPADLAFHRFFWSGLLMLPLIVREGLRDLGGIGWSRASVMAILSGPPQSLLAYTGFVLVPLGHGTTIQPACAALSGLVLASLILHEKATLQRIIGGAIIIAGLLMFGVELPRPSAIPVSAVIFCLPRPDCSGRHSAPCCGFGMFPARGQSWRSALCR